MSVLIQGLLIGLAYVAPIGMQNMYVINTAIGESRLKALQTALIVIFFDITLALACFAGLGLILDRIEILKMILLGAGGLAVCYIGITLIRSKPSTYGDLNLQSGFWKRITPCFVITWLNPQAIIDGSLLLAGFRASLNQSEGNFFIAGVSIASASWFLILSMLVSIFKSRISNRFLKLINIICGSILILFAGKLIFHFIREYIIPLLQLAA